MPCIVIKVGGALIEEPYGSSLANDIAMLVQNGNLVLLVHGGGPQLDRAIHLEGRTPQKIAGRRITSAEDLALAVRVWRGDISTQWIRLLTKESVCALGLTGQDAQLIQAQKRPKTTVRTAEGKEKEVDFGFVGDIQKINKNVIQTLWKGGITPVIAPLGTSLDGMLLNINADTIATSLAIALHADALVLLSNIPGLLQNHQDPNSRIPHVTSTQAQELLRNGTIRAGMRPKVDSILNALHKGVKNIHLADGREGRILSRLFVQNEPLGTHFSIGTQKS